MQMFLYEIDNKAMTANELKLDIFVFLSIVYTPLQLLEYYKKNIKNKISDKYLYSLVVNYDYNNDFKQ